MDGFLDEFNINLWSPCLGSMHGLCTVRSNVADGSADIDAAAAVGGGGVAGLGAVALEAAGRIHASAMAAAGRGDAFIHICALNLQ